MQQFQKFSDNLEILVEQVLIPAEDEVENNDLIPDRIILEMQKLGLFGLTIPEIYGGLGSSVEEEVEIMFTLGKTSPAFWQLVGTNQGIGGQSILIAGNEQQKNHFLPKLATGELITAFALTEENAGSDASAIQTTAIKNNNGWILNGKKRYITNATEAGLLIIMACTNNCNGKKEISAFLVEASNKGLTVAERNKKMGQRGSHTAEVILNDCYVTDFSLLGNLGSGFTTAIKALDRGRLHLAAIAVGMAERLIAVTASYANKRFQFGKAISEFQLIQGMLADSVTEAYAAKCMVKNTAKLLALGERNCSPKISCCKLFATEMVCKVADRAVQVHGGTGYISGRIEQFYRDSRVFRIYEGTNQIQQLIIAKDLLKMYRG